MNTPNTFRHWVLQSSAAALLGCSMLMPSAASAAQPTSTGTLVGTVTCGPIVETPAAHVEVGIEGINLMTRTDATGRFTLLGVPAGQTYTIDVSTDSARTSMASRYDVPVLANQTLDIGSLDLAVCPPLVQPVQADDQARSEYLQHDNW
jgi:hypothetical protein